MKYVGLYTQVRRNNRLTVFLLLMFPVIILITVWVFLLLVNYFGNGYYNEYGEFVNQVSISDVNYYFLQALPWVVGGVGVWFLFAYFNNTAMIKSATGARPLERRENPRVYNIVENLCMTCGMNMPKVNIIDDPMLNAFASGIDEKSYTVTVTTGLLDTLDDRELAGVIGHELTHIRNRDTRLLVVSIVFVGIISTIMSMTVNFIDVIMRTGGASRRSNDDKGGGISIIVALIIALVCSAIAYFFTSITRFAISRRREYMADAGGAELCGDPRALASALHKISGMTGLQQVKRDDIAQLFIARPQALNGKRTSFLSSLFATHPNINKRIEILEQF